MDYPIYNVVPKSSFSCDGRREGGYYGDPETKCQAFHICTNDGNNSLTKNSFLCPNGTLFQQKLRTCDYWYNVDCSTTEDFYDRTNRAGRVADPGSCLTRFPSDPLGQKEGDPRATACLASTL